MLHMGRRQPSTSRTHSAGASRSQAMLEFALALPVLLMLIFGIVDFALIFQAWLSVENIARQTVRLAVTGEYDPSFCPVIGPGGLAGCQGDTYLQEQDVARLETIRRDAGQWEVALFKSPTNNQSAKGYLHVTVCSNRDANHSGTRRLCLHSTSARKQHVRRLLPHGRCRRSGRQRLHLRRFQSSTDHTIPEPDLAHDSPCVLSPGRRRDVPDLALDRPTGPGSAAADAAPPAPG